MTLLFADGLDSGLSKFVTFGSTTFNPTAGVYGGGAMQMSAGADASSGAIITFTPSGLTNNPTTRISFWMRTNATVTNESFFWELRQFQGASSEYSFGSVWTDGKLTTWNWDTAGHNTVVRPVNYPRLDDGNWHHIEFRFKFASSGGLYGFIIDGIYNFSYTIDFVASLISDATLLDTLELRNFRNGTVWYDDLIIWNENDTGDNFSSVLGPSRIFTLRPDADTAQANSVPSSGSDRYLMLNEPTLNTANYVTLSVGGKDFYEMSNIANVGGAIYGAQATLFFNSALPGYTANLRPIIVSNNVERPGNTITSVTTTRQEITLRFNNDFGNGNTRWTEATINDIKIGFENTG